MTVAGLRSKRTTSLEDKIRQMTVCEDHRHQLPRGTFFEHDHSLKMSFGVADKIACPRFESSSTHREQKHLQDELEKTIIQEIAKLRCQNHFCNSKRVRFLVASIVISNVTDKCVECRTETSKSWA